ncbi:LAMI_0C06238g1_1 [Lachancea mirantina]|uniref:LAMI_0C06238g1_1 n=1 Tax=Lachancea mirantina TaxID=1230905 RepID=A0A1G4J3L0_9SACH|nr:LAMI_0C06238g1_1 [Lachancea mirantina]
MGRPRKEVSQKIFENFQMELELAGQDVDLLLKDKRGRSRACLLCRRRKRRCDQKLPSCTMCLKAGVKCIQPVNYSSRSAPDSPSPGHREDSEMPDVNDEKDSVGNGGKGGQKDEYTRFLERKLRYLERLINLPPDSAPYRERWNNYKHISHLMGNNNTSSSNAGSEAESSPFQFPPVGKPESAASSPILPPPTRVKFFPLQNEPFGSSERPSSPAAHNRAHLSALASDSLESIDFSSCIFAKYNVMEFSSYNPAFEFDEKLSRTLLDIFFSRLQFKYPLLDEQEIYSFHSDFISNNVHSYSNREFHFACGRMWLIFSIGACLHKSTGKYRGLPPGRYFSTAIRHITRCGSSLTYIQQVEVLTLLVLYIIRTDCDSIGPYNIIKDVMTICKDKLFLNQWKEQDIFASKKLRLFWCVYLLERMICVAVGKPYTIAESEINLPLFDEGSFNTNSIHDQTRHKRGVHFINQSLQLRRIESQFVETLQIIPQTPAKKKTSMRKPDELAAQLPQVKDFFRQLEIWRSNCSVSHVRNFENETLKLYYYRSVRLLIQPYLEFLEPKNRLFRECQAAAGQICQLYKIFHQKTAFGHSTPAVHTIFVAGTTLIYCMWLARNLDDERRRKLGDSSRHTRPLVSGSLFSTLDDLRACSVCLYVMAERSKFAITFRDTFDHLMNATVGNLIERCGPDSSELIYVQGDGDSDVDAAGFAINSEAVSMEEGTFSSKEKHGGGMPPAMERTYGTLQANEHAGFVENSQMDPEEQKQLKKKRDDVEEAVPKSLTSLLAGNSAATDKANQSGVVDSKAVTGDKDAARSVKERYIVQKPLNAAESNWETFQQQALMQQHHAQQTLQAYLASLNGKVSPQTNYRPAKDINTNNGKFDSQAAASNITKSVDAKAVGQGIETENSKPAGINASAASCYPRPLSNVNANSKTTLTSTGLAPLSAFPQNFSSDGIMFHNGAHTMINNISSWTSDSVENLLNEHMGQNQLSKDFVPSNSTGYNVTFGNWPTPQDRSSKMDSNTIASVPSGGVETNKVNPAVPNHAWGHVDGIQVDHVLGSPVEEFWTVNDDYGFLA